MHNFGYFLKNNSIDISYFSTEIFPHLYLAVDILKDYNLEFIL